MYSRFLEVFNKNKTMHCQILEYKVVFFLYFQCNSPVIIGFYGAFFDENRISICTEFMDGKISCSTVLQIMKHNIFQN